MSFTEFTNGVGKLTRSKHSQFVVENFGVSLSLII
jgi:hypothetical protein